MPVEDGLAAVDLGRGGDGRVGSWGDVLVAGRGGSLGRRLGLVALLAGAVDGDLDCDLAAVDGLAVHLGASLELQLLGAESDEAEAAPLALLAAGLELLDHEARNGSERNLGGRRLVVLEDLNQLRG
jgi:hypothetical protein